MPDFRPLPAVQSGDIIMLMTFQPHVTKGAISSPVAETFCIQLRPIAIRQCGSSQSPLNQNESKPMPDESGKIYRKMLRRPTVPLIGARIVTHACSS